jgi:sugar lactone lactonase YvrE
MTGRISVGSAPLLVASDGADLWVSNITSGTVTRVRASDGTVLGTWTGATSAYGVLVALGRIYVIGDISFVGRVYVIDPSTAPGAVTTLSNSLGGGPRGIASDGTSIWTANSFGSVSNVDPDNGTTTNFTTGFTQPQGILFDGTNIWVTDVQDNKLKKLAFGNVIQNVPVGSSPQFPVFDGASIWVPNSGSNSLTVVRARDGMVLATLTGNGLNFPQQAAFDGQRILVTNGSGNSVSLWKAADLTPIGSVSTGASTNPVGVCSDGINFWITLQGTNQLARF